MNQSELKAETRKPPQPRENASDRGLIGWEIGTSFLDQSEN